MCYSLMKDTLGCFVSSFIFPFFPLLMALITDGTNDPTN